MSIELTGLGEDLSGKGAISDSEAAVLAVRERLLLKQRARDLARVPPSETDPADRLELVEFEIGSEHYALELGEVREVCALKDLTPIPTASPVILGIINLRGEIYTVLDLRRLLDLPGTALSDLSKALILTGEETRASVLADRILGVRSIRPEDLQAAAPAGLRGDYLRGVTSERLIVLSAAKILADPGVLVSDEL